MKLTDARATALALMATHGLRKTGWTFTFDRATQRLALCNHLTRTIQLGETFTRSAEEDDVTQALLHEIAHALVGPTHAHNAVWKRMARSIGHSGERTGRNPAHDAKEAAQLAVARAVAPIRADVTSGPLGVGDLVITQDGRTSGLIISVARTRCTVFNTSDSEFWTVPMASLRRISDPPIAVVVPPPVDPTIVVGDRIATRDGVHTGTVMKVARTRYHFRADADGRLYSVRFPGAKRLLEPGAQAVGLPSTEQQPTVTVFVVGDRIRAIKPGSQYHGLCGSVQSVGPKNYRVLLDSGVVLVASPWLLSPE